MGRAGAAVDGNGADPPTAGGLTGEEIGARIRAARTSRGWTHEELARRMGVNWRTVHRWQQGQLPRVERLIRLAEVLEVPQAYFVEPEDEGATLADLRDRLDELSRRVEALTRALERLDARGRRVAGR